MNQAMLNTELYQTMYAEQERYKAELLCMPRKKLRMSAGPPQVLACSFSPYTCHGYWICFRTAIGLWHVRQSYPHIQPSWFLFVRPVIFLQLPSDSQLPRTPLLLAIFFPLSGGLGTFTLCRWAHQKHRRAAVLLCGLTYMIYWPRMVIESLPNEIRRGCLKMQIARE